MKRRIFRARISLSFVNFNFLERNRELSLNNRERTIGKPINQISIDISFEPGIYSSHSVAPDKNRGGKLRGNIETGVSIIAAKMSDGVSAHASVCALGSYVARPLKKKKKLKSDPILENATAFPIENSLLSDETRDTTQRDFYLSKLNRMATGDGGRGGEEGMIGQRAKKKKTKRKREKRGREREERKGKKILPSSLV